MIAKFSVVMSHLLLTLLRVVLSAIVLTIQIGPIVLIPILRWLRFLPITGYSHALAAHPFDDNTLHQTLWG